MDITILLPHYRTGEMTAYSIYQFLKNKGKHNVKIIVSDNNAGDGTIEYLKPFQNDIKVVNYPKDKLQSHGISLDVLIPTIETEYFITAESDSFPTKENWLDYYDEIIEQGFDAAGSFMQLSGGFYMHPAGALYSKKVWQECKEFCDNIPYTYFPNMWNKEGFDGHTMIHNDVLNEVLNNPIDYFDLAKGYDGLTKDQILEKAKYYSATVCPFHNGMGCLQESVRSYGVRSIEKGIEDMNITDRPKIIFRVGEEPGQFFTYWMLANGKKLHGIETETVWMKGREGQQQEYTLMSNGFRHIWGVSSYVERGSKGVEDIYEAKRKIPFQLYNSLPSEFKIK